MADNQELQIINHFIDNNPKNKRRRRNKIILENKSFELVFDKQKEDIVIAKKDDLYFSIIPYDTSRKYIETATLLYNQNPEFLDEYLLKHQENLSTYVKLALFQVTGERYESTSPEVLHELSFLEKDIYFKIQVVGRLLQHDETGPLSATLPYKFLYQFNMKTGIHGYINEWLTFLKQTKETLPLSIGSTQQLLIEENNSLTDAYNTELALLEVPYGLTLRKSELSQAQLTELMTIRKDYKAHSKHPSEIQEYFDLVHPNRTDNLINVVSDIQSNTGELLLESPNFNILAGNLIHEKTVHPPIPNDLLKGIAVIGNHDIVQCVKQNSKKYSKEWQDGLFNVDDKDFRVLKITDEEGYDLCKAELEKLYPHITFLNNDVFYHEGVRYLGLTVPVSYVQERFLVQKILASKLIKLLDGDRDIPTVIISHAPLFNELSLLSPDSSSYQKEWVCENSQLAQIFSDYNILGVIHGHHLIPASSGMIDFREFMGKELFVLCSIYSSLNNGFDLEPVLKQLIRKQERNDS